MIRRSETLLLSGVLLGICTIALWPVLAAKTEGSGKIPPDFPKDFPIYNNASIVSYGPILRSNPKLGNVLVLQTPDAKANVLDFYKVELPANGWTLQTFDGAPDTLAANKGERRIAVNVNESESSSRRHTAIQLTVNETP